jgi:spermidine/putrescine transport system substrate-binding protein
MKRRAPQSAFRRSRFGYGLTSRRRFLQTSAAALSGLALANCNRRGISDVQSGAEDPDSPPAAGTASGPLRIYTWADYTDEEVTRTFTERTGIEVVVDVYDSNETMLARLQAGGGDAYSIIYPSDYMVAQMLELDLLADLDHSQLIGLEDLDPLWRDPSYDPGNAHSVPYSWGTTGILYNTELMSAAIADWDDLWENQDELMRRLTLLDDMREVLGASLKSLGYSYNATDPAELEAAYQKLVDLKPAIASFQSFGWENQILSGDLLAVMAFSVDAIAATFEDPNLDYIVPTSGSALWVDTMVIPKAAPNPEAAYAWINMTLEPEVAAGMVERLYFATPLQSAFELLSPELQNNPDLFPPEEILAKCEEIAPLSSDVLDLYDRLWTELTSA